MTATDKRILLVEDEEIFFEDILEALEEAGYTVDHAKNLDSALQLLYTRHYHLLITDILLEGDDLQNDSTNGGVQLLDHIRAGVLSQSLTRVILTNYPRTSWLETRQWRIFRLLRKFNTQPYQTDDYIERLMKAVKDAFRPGQTSQERLQDHIYHNPNFSLNYVANSDRRLIPAVVSHIMKDEGDKLETQTYRRKLKEQGILIPPLDEEALQYQVYELIGKLFPEDDSVFISSMSPGLTGASVIRAMPTRHTGVPGDRYVIKIGRRDKIEREYDNYRRFIHDNLTSGAVTALDIARTRDLSAIKYRFAENDRNAELSEFDSLYFDKNMDARTVANSLRILFKKTFKRLHDARRLELQPLPEKYYEAFELQEKGNLQRVLDEIMGNPDLAMHVDDFHPDAPTFKIAALNTPLLNPIHWLEDKRDWSVMPAWYAVTHGDLTGRNIMSDSSPIEYEGEDIRHCKLWLIDFYRTGYSHVLRDHVILETDIKYRLLQDLSLTTFLELEYRLLRPNWQPRQVSDPEEMQMLERAHTVIDEIHHCAMDLTHGSQPDEKRLELYFALLLATLNVIRLKHIEPHKKLQALLSASLICYRIEEIKSGKADYPDFSQQPDIIPDVEPVAESTFDYEQIARALLERKSLLFIGRRAGSDETFPTPYKLSGELMKEINYTPNPTENHRILASIFVMRKDRQTLVRRHREYYARFTPPPIFSLVAAAGWRDIFTTNQHSFLEDALRLAGRSFQLVNNAEDLRVYKPESPTVYKLYSSLNTSNFPLTDEEYEAMYHRYYTEMCQQKMMEHLYRGEDVVLLYPSSTDIQTLHKWINDAEDKGNVYVVSDEVLESDLIRMKTARIHHIDKSPLMFMEKLLDTPLIRESNKNQPRDQIFISYAHRDSDYLKEFLQHLKPLSRHGIIPRPWSDNQIKPGEDWRSAINQALNHAGVAILLISPAFISSDFIHNEELQPILEASKRGELVVFAVSLRLVAHQHLKDLSDIQWANDPQKPIARVEREEKRDEEWVKIVRKLEDVFSDFIK